MVSFFFHLQVIHNLQTAFADRPEVLVTVVALSQSFESLYKSEVSYACLFLQDLAFYVQGWIILAVTVLIIASIVVSLMYLRA